MDFISTTEAAKLLGVNRMTVGQWVRDGHIPAYKFGGAYRLKRTELDEWIEAQRVS